MGWRDIKNRARRDLHSRMLVPAFYYGPLDGMVARAINVRVHTKFDALGDVKGTSFGYAERIESVPKLIFMREEIEPVLHAVIVISAEEGYRVNVIEPPDGITRTAKVTVLTAGDLARYISPDEGLPVAGHSVMPRPNSQPPSSHLPRPMAAGLLSLTYLASGSSDIPRPQ